MSNSNTNKSTYDRRIELTRWEAEEYQCAMVWLDTIGVETHDPLTGEKFSIVGRIMYAISHSEVFIENI